MLLLTGQVETWIKALLDFKAQAFNSECRVPTDKIKKLIKNWTIEEG
jgi:hypothetical protein